MPNWCVNNAVLTAPSKEDLDRLVTSLETEENERFFNALRPRPLSESENWYEWNVNNWGTKWDTEPSNIDRIDEITLDLAFDTAWGPPIALYEFLVDQGWQVNAMYHECGMGFCGMFNEDGDSTWEYNFEDETTIDEIPDDLLEWAGIRYEYNNWKEEQENEDNIDNID